MANKQPMTEALKRAIELSGLNFKALQRETGVTRQSLMAFMKDQRTLRLDMADRVANYFGLTVGPASGHLEIKFVSNQPETKPAANPTVELATNKSKRKKAK